MVQSGALSPGKTQIPARSPAHRSGLALRSVAAQVPWPPPV